MFISTETNVSQDINVSYTKDTRIVKDVLPGGIVKGNGQVMGNRTCFKQKII